MYLLIEQIKPPRDVADAPKLAVGDGALGFWAAMAEEFPEAREQRCWVHKTANILDKLPTRMQPQAKKLIHEMYLAATRDDAEKAHERFIAEYGAKWPKAVDCLIRDHDGLFAFYDFPADPGSSPGPSANDKSDRIGVCHGSFIAHGRPRDAGLVWRH